MYSVINKVLKKKKNTTSDWVIHMGYSALYLQQDVFAIHILKVMVNYTAKKVVSLQTLQGRW